MSDPHDSSAKVVQTYYDILKQAKDSSDLAGLRAVLDPDLAFEGPISGHQVGAESFITGVSGFVETMRSMDFLHQLSVGDRAATLYYAEMPGGSVRFAELFQVERGKIRSLRLLYDAARYGDRAGR
ncbi:MAG: nuclear transport factor 2 family protein [Candidatus Dormiibacterota bacterium]